MTAVFDDHDISGDMDTGLQLDSHEVIERLQQQASQLTHTRQ